MRNNIIASLIIAGAIVLTGFMFRQAATTSAGTQIDSVFSSLDEAATKKDAKGKTRLSKIIEGVSGSMADGIKEGFGKFESEEEQKKKDELPIRDKLEIREVKIVPGRMKNEERVIGILKNRGDSIVSEIKLNVVIKDKDGKLLDVCSDNFTQVEGILKPGDELGFGVPRELGNFEDKDEALNQRKGASAVVSIVAMKIIK